MNYTLFDINTSTSGGPEYNITEGYFYNEVGEKIMITFWENPTDKTFGSEVYSGENYIIESTKRSYSRNYKSLHNLPKKYEGMVIELKKFSQWQN